MKDIDWIFFDVGGVIVDEEPFQIYFVEQVKMMLGKHGIKISADDFWRSFYEASARPKGLVYRGTLDILIPASVANKEELIDSGVALMKERPFKLTDVRPQLLEVSHELSKKYKLGIMANQPQENQKWIDESGILKYFTHTHMSHHYKLYKPDSAFYKTILDEVCTSTERSVNIDDNIERGLRAAKEIGIHTVWYKTRERENPPLQYVDATITSLKDLLDIF